MLNYTIVNEVPSSSERITVITTDNQLSITICDYQNGKELEGGIYYSVADFDEDILKYPYQKQVFVLEDAEIIFSNLWDNAELFRKSGNMDDFAEALEKKCLGITE